MIALAGTWTITTAGNAAAGTGGQAVGSVVQYNSIWVQASGGVTLAGPYQVTTNPADDNTIAFTPAFGSGVAGATLWVSKDGPIDAQFDGLAAGIVNYFQRFGSLLDVAGANKLVNLNKTAAADSAGAVFKTANANKGRVGTFGDDLTALQQDINNGSMTSLLKAVVTGSSPSQTLGCTLVPIVEQSATALVVGRIASTPALKINTNTASSVTGWEIVAAAAAGGVALKAISSGSNENAAIDAKGSGTLTLQGTATGNIVLARAVSTQAITASGPIIGHWGGSSEFVAQFLNDANSDTSHGILIRGGSNGGSGAALIYFRRGNDGSTLGTITQASASAVSYNTSSDIRGKPNRERLSLDYARTIVDALEIWDFDRDGNEIRGIGVLAQQARAVHQSLATPGQQPQDWWMTEKAAPMPFVVANLQLLNQQVGELRAALAPP